MLSSNQIRAARGLLGWTQEELAQRIDLTRVNLSAIEKGTQQAKQSTLKRLLNVFTLAGLEFLPDDGLRRRNDMVTVIDEPLEEAYPEVLRLALSTMEAGKEILIFNADGALSPPVVIDLQKQLLAKGVILRFLARPNSLRNHADALYRDLPSATDAQTFQAILGDLVFTRLIGRDRTVIVKDNTFAVCQTELFNMVWDHAV